MLHKGKSHIFVLKVGKISDGPLIACAALLPLPPNTAGILASLHWEFHIFRTILHLGGWEEESQVKIFGKPQKEELWLVFIFLTQAG